MESASFLFYALVSMNKYNVLNIVYRLNLIVLLKAIWDKTIVRKKKKSTMWKNLVQNAGYYVYEEEQLTCHKPAEEKLLS